MAKAKLGVCKLTCVGLALGMLVPAVAAAQTGGQGAEATLGSPQDVELVFSPRSAALDTEGSRKLDGLARWLRADKSRRVAVEHVAVEGDEAAALLAGDRLSLVRTYLRDEGADPSSVILPGDEGATTRGQVRTVRVAVQDSEAGASAKSGVALNQTLTGATGAPSSTPVGLTPAALTTSGTAGMAAAQPAATAQAAAAAQRVAAAQPTAAGPAGAAAQPTQHSVAAAGATQPRAPIAAGAAQPTPAPSPQVPPPAPATSLPPAPAAVRTPTAPLGAPSVPAAAAVNQPGTSAPVATPTVGGTLGGVTAAPASVGASDAALGTSGEAGASATAEPPQVVPPATPTPARRPAPEVRMRPAPVSASPGHGNRYDFGDSNEDMSGQALVWRQPSAPAFTTAGFGLTVGGGVIGFWDRNTSDVAPVGGAWEARLLYGTRTVLAAEAAYIGSAQALNAAGMPDDAVLLGNGAEGNIRLNFTRSAVQPYVFGGAGWTHYSVTRSGANSGGMGASDNVFHVPVGVGLTLRNNGLLFDIRGTARLAFDETLMNGMFGNRDGNLDSWSGSARLGWEF